MLRRTFPVVRPTAAATTRCFTSATAATVPQHWMNSRCFSSSSNNNNHNHSSFPSSDTSRAFFTTGRTTSTSSVSSLAARRSSETAAAGKSSFLRSRFFLPSTATLASSLRAFSSTSLLRDNKKNTGGGSALQGVYSLRQRTPEDEERDRKKQEEEEEDDGKAHNMGYLPFPEPFHTFNIMMLLLLGNVGVYLIMNFAPNDDVRDWMIEHFTLSHDNWWKVYPLLTHSLYQENLFQLAIDVWLLTQFGRTQLGFLGNTRLTFFWALCTLGGAAIHIARQKFMLYYEMDPIEVRGRAFGPNPFILGLVGLEGLIFRNMNFLQNPPVPFLVLTAGVMIIDVWRIFTMKPEEHGASTGGALVAYIMWALPTRMLGLDKLTASI